MTNLYRSYRSWASKFYQILYCVSTIYCWRQGTAKRSDQFYQ